LESRQRAAREPRESRERAVREPLESGPHACRNKQPAPEGSAPVTRGPSAAWSCAGCARGGPPCPVGGSVGRSGAECQGVRERGWA
jgi:hypothetical protein